MMKALKKVNWKKLGIFAGGFQGLLLIWLLFFSQARMQRTYIHIVQLVFLEQRIVS